MEIINCTKLWSSRVRTLLTLVLCKFSFHLSELHEFFLGINFKRGQRGRSRILMSFLPINSPFKHKLAIKIFQKIGENPQVIMYLLDEAAKHVNNNWLILVVNTLDSSFFPRLTRRYSILYRGWAILQLDKQPPAHSANLNCIQRKEIAGWRSRKMNWKRD